MNSIISLPDQRKDISFAKLIESQIIDKHIETFYYSDLELDIGGKKWMTHQWIWKARLGYYSGQTEFEEILHKASQACAKHFLLWLYTDSTDSKYIKLSDYEKCTAIIETCYILTLRGIYLHELKMNPLNDLNKRIGMLSLDDCKRLLEFSVQYIRDNIQSTPTEEMCRVANDNIHKLIANRFRSLVPESERPMHCLNLSLIIEKYDQFDQLKLFGIYMQQKDLHYVDMTSESSKGLVEDMRKYVKAKEYTSLSFEFESGVSSDLYVPSILWSQCISLRDYIESMRKSEPIRISMTDLKLISDVSHVSWNEMLTFFHCNEIDFEKIGQDIFTLYEFFAYRSYLYLGKMSLPTTEDCEFEYKEQQEVFEEASQLRKLEYLEELMAAYISQRAELSFTNMAAMLNKIIGNLMSKPDHVGRHEEIISLLTEHRFISQACINISPAIQNISLPLSVKTIIHFTSERLQKEE